LVNSSESYSGAAGSITTEDLQKNPPNTPQITAILKFRKNPTFSKFVSSYLIIHTVDKIINCKVLNNSKAIS